jgi:proteasome lid subunit RPN8/RPN11
MYSKALSNKNSLAIPIGLWQALILDLRKRGNNVRESGAFLLGKPTEYTLTKHICYDDLDPNSLETGMVIFDSRGFMPLFEYCSSNGLVVYADIHTHPRNRTDQSEYDRTNPTIAIAGHMCLIVPNYAQSNFADFNGVGIYEYESNYKWKKHSIKSEKIECH